MDLLVIIEKYIEFSLKRDNLNVFISTQEKQKKADSKEVEEAKSELEKLAEPLTKLKQNYLKIISTIDANELKNVFDVLAERKQATLDELEAAIQHRNLIQAKVDKAFDEGKFESERILYMEHFKAVINVGNLRLKSEYYDAFVQELAIRLERDFGGPKL